MIEIDLELLRSLGEELYKNKDVRNYLKHNYTVENYYYTDKCDRSYDELPYKQLFLIHNVDVAIIDHRTKELMIRLPYFAHEVKKGNLDREKAIGLIEKINKYYPIII